MARSSISAERMRLLHVGEISWHRVNKPSDVLSVGQQIEAVIIKIDSGQASHCDQH